MAGFCNHAESINYDLQREIAFINRRLDTYENFVADLVNLVSNHTRQISEQIELIAALEKRTR